MRWPWYWAELERRIDSLFARSEARQRAIPYLAGLLSPAERKNIWQLGEISGDTTPYGFQRLLARADWEVVVSSRRLWPRFSARNTSRCVLMWPRSH